jgi:hypothetical protein
MGERSDDVLRTAIGDGAVMRAVQFSKFLISRKCWQNSVDASTVREYILTIPLQGASNNNDFVVGDPAALT